jgi:hypothetical protein
MKLITKDIKNKLSRNVGNADVDKPYLKLFNPAGIGTWLISEYNEDTGIMFGLCDLGYPELGYVSLEEIESVKLPFGLKIERDMYFEPTKTLKEYASNAKRIGSIRQ